MNRRDSVLTATTVSQLASAIAMLPAAAAMYWCLVNGHLLFGLVAAVAGLVVGKLVRLKVYSAWKHE